MDYKKKYEESLAKAKEEIKKCGDNKGRIGIIENIFPELKESEDEKIRKSLIGHLKECRNNTRSEVMIGEYAKWIAWLEKQGKKIDVIENFNTEFERQISHLIASTINKEYEYNEDFVKWTANALLNYAKHELEKQDEHKCDCKYVGCHVNNMKRWCHKKQSEILYEKCNIKCSEYLKQGEQKPTCKLDNTYTCVKFPFKAKVKSTGKIVTIHDGQLSMSCKEWIKYQSDFEDGYRVYKPDELELVCEVEQKPTEWSDRDWYYYSKLESFLEVKDHYSPTESSSGYQKDVHETLIWLKSLRPNKYVTWSEEDKRMINNIIKNLDEGEWLDIYQVDWLKSLKERVQSQSN